MKFPILPKSLIALTLGACFLAPASSFADRKSHSRRDHNGGGHHNFSSRGHYGSGYSRGHSGHHHGSHRYHSSRSYGYRNYGYSRPYYGYGGYGYGYGSSFGSSFGVSLYSQPSYYYSQPSYYYSQPSYYSERYVSRSVAPRVSRSYQDSLAVDVQQELKRRGYYRGGIDGEIGPASRSAIRAYQADRGLSVTGRIDRSLLGALGIG